jgi:hypothetical protein
MSKELTVVALGVWVIIVPFLGVPSSWREWILLATGLALVLLGLMLRATEISRGTKRGGHHTFVENSATDTLEHISEHARKERITSLN